MEDWAVKFHQEGSRDAITYFNVLQKTFPNVRAIAELHPGLFTTCFDMFTDAVGKYEEKAEEIKKRAIKIWEASKRKSEL